MKVNRENVTLYVSILERKEKTGMPREKPWKRRRDHLRDLGFHHPVK